MSKKRNILNEPAKVQTQDPCGCDTRHPLERDGTSQAQRLLAALDTSSVLVDEHSLNDLLVFAKDYAQLLNYYKPSGTGIVADGDWEVFLRNDITVLVAIVSKENVQEVRMRFRSTIKTVRDSANINAPYDALILFRDLLQKMSDWYSNSDSTTLFHKELRLYFQSMLLDGWIKLTDLDQQSAQNVLQSFKLEENSEWQALFDTAWAKAAVPDGTIYSGTTIAEKNRSAANALQSVFEKYTAALQMIINRCPVYIATTINDYPLHKSHMGLFITFLELFAYAQKHINKITDRHLNFFYQEVLQLTPQKAVSDTVHVIFSLARNAAETYLVPENTSLKAGKDATGVELFYATDDDIVVNKATVALFKNLYVDETTVSSQHFTGLFASSVANSSDGKGAELDKTSPQWTALGLTQQGLESAEHTMPDARIGFAIASPQLLLAEGTRIITLTIDFSEELDFTDTGLVNANILNSAYYRISLTSTKLWLDSDADPSPFAPVVIEHNNKQLVFKIELSALQPAVTAYSSKVHGGTYTAIDPLLKIELLNVNGTGDTWQNLYPVFSKLKVKKARVKVNVKEMKSLVLHNEFSKIDPAKPFMPFGQQPLIGSPFYVGSKEIFFKKLDSLNLDIDWHGTPVDFSMYYANYKYDGPAGADVVVNLTNTSFTGTYKVLANGSWPKEDAPGTNFISLNENNVAQTTSYLFNAVSANLHVAYSFNTVFTARAVSADVFEEELLGSTRGYLKINLQTNDFQHTIYPMAVGKQALQGIGGKIPHAPYTPTIKTFSASYISDQTLDSVFDQFYYLQPFGEELNATVLNTDSDLPLVPLFVVSKNDSAEKISQSGMLFIGLSDLEPQKSLSLLVQVVEDSGDHDLVPPTINWSYLQNNTWVTLTAQQLISDTSNGFQTSGIVELDIPEEATNNNTILPSGYHWIRASAANEDVKQVAALCNLLDIVAQAVRASFRDNGNDVNHLATPLASETIAKLNEPVAEVKSVTQPYASFGGKVAEEGNNYYRRVSERLRHKGRAVTMWDYERLVLENFPSIYKVKCISHTRDIAGYPTCYYELAPGNVLVMAVSNLRNQNDVDKLQPKTSVNTRNEIKTFLSKRASKFAKIAVINPDYEEIQVACKVTYLPEYQKDKGYYDNLLIEDIKKFLSPWAYDEGFDIVFGGKIHSSYIINFIEERPYVDYLEDFKMTRLASASDPTELTAEEISVSFAKSILVSAVTHNINTES
jgi:uncharacterized protein (DUF2267 family)